ncbi:MAG: hypothetical protein K2N46_01985, partial [Lachnospiraceae bacterium]|nr:hypothetical protein [Lachnospiraceae bacterium]
TYFVRLIRTNRLQCPIHSIRAQITGGVGRPPRPVRKKRGAEYPPRPIRKKRGAEHSPRPMKSNPEPALKNRMREDS